MTTYASWVAALLGMTVAGCARVYTDPPGSLTTADLPALWPMLPEGGSAAQAFGATAHRREMAVDLYYALSPTAQSTAGERYAAQLAALDVLQAALEAIDATVPYIMRWEMRADLLANGRVDYAGVVVRVMATVIEG